jgi:hypothetical protein
MTAESIIADALTARILEHLSPVHVRLIRDKTIDIRRSRRGMWAKNAEMPKMSLIISRRVHGIPGIGPITFNWKCDCNANAMKLKAEVPFGQNDDVVIAGQIGKINADIPQSAIASLVKAPIERLIESDLLKGYNIHRFVDETLYLKVPEMREVGEIVDSVEDPDMSYEEFLRFLYDNDVYLIDRVTHRFLRRTSEYRTLAERLALSLDKEKRIPDRSDRQTAYPSVEGNDLIAGLDYGANLYFHIKVKDYKRVLSIHYRAERIAYAYDTLTWMGSQRSSWYHLEDYAFSCVFQSYGSPLRRQHRNRMEPVDIRDDKSLRGHIKKAA